MLTYNMNEYEKKPIYQWLYENIKEDITVGTLMADEKLPSKRNLASQLKISVMTVENAYAQLIAEGYVYSFEKRGYYVSNITPSFKQSINNLNINNLNIQKHHQAKCKTKYKIDLTSNTSNPNVFPFSIWSKLIRLVLNTYQTEILETGSFQGNQLLREEIAKHIYDFHGMVVDSECIVVGAGTEYLYSMIIQLLGRKNIYALEDPGYSKIRSIYTANDIPCMNIPLDESGLSIKALKRTNSNVIHISPAHHFPTGIVMPIKRRQELLEWANKDNRYIIEDDYDSEFRFVGKPIPTMKSIDTNEKVIYINTFSKTISPSLRVSYLILPKHLMHKYENELGFYSCTVPSFTQYTLAEFIKNGYLEQHINRMRIFYRNIRDTLIEKLEKSNFHNKIQITEKDAGLHFLLHFKSTHTFEEISTAITKNNVNISWLHEYYYNPDENREITAVINYSSMTNEKIDDFVTILETILS